MSEDEVALDNWQDLLPGLFGALIQGMEQEALAAELSQRLGMAEEHAAVVVGLALSCLQAAAEIQGGTPQARVRPKLMADYGLDEGTARSLLAMADEAMTAEARRRALLEQVAATCAKMGLAPKVLELLAGMVNEGFDALDAGESIRALDRRLAAQLSKGDKQGKVIHDSLMESLPALHRSRTRLRAGEKLPKVLESEGLDQAPPLLQLLAMHLFAGYA